MTSRDIYSARNRFKLHLGEIYNKPDPRPYFNTLGPLDYMIPENAKPVFQAVFESLKRTRGLDRVNILDLGCSYGVNSALLKYDMSMEDLYQRYTSPDICRLGCSELLQRDVAMLERRDGNEDLYFVGVDAASRAVEYATRAGLLDEGVAANLEQSDVPPEAANKIDEVDVIITTGCVGYVTEETFDHLLGSIQKEPRPWVASFVLRMFPYGDIRSTLDRHGLRTEKFKGCTFVQRQFATPEEQQHVVEKLEEMGIDTVGKEASGGYHACFFLSRPPEEARELPLEALLEDVLSAGAGL